MAFRPAVHVPLMLAGLGVIFIVAGLLILFDPSAKRDLAHGAALSTATASALRLHSAGDVVLMEGRLAAGNRAVFRDFVACRRDRFAGVETSGPSKGRERWTPLETLAMPLTIETGDGTVAVVNQGYELRGSPHQWRDVPMTTELLGKTGERASGFFAGDVVTVEGRVVDAATAGRATGGHALEARVLFGGDHAAYLADLQGGVLASRILGGVFLGVGGLLTVIAALLLGRAKRKGK